MRNASRDGEVTNRMTFRVTKVEQILHTSESMAGIHRQVIALDAIEVIQLEFNNKYLHVITQKCE